MSAYMPGFTAALMAVFVAFLGAWYLGKVEGNFALLLFLVTAVCGLYWLAERLYFAPQRRKAVQALDASQAQRLAQLKAQGIDKVDEADFAQARQALAAQPWWLDWTAGLFPVLAIVFLLRSFLYEPFKIPSGSMIPTLEVGDLILVNKFTYGVRLPVLHHKIVQGDTPQRGDVVVFRYPPNPTQDYIKRVVAVGGDTVAYTNKRLNINGTAVPTAVLPDYFDAQAMRYFGQIEEKLGERSHRAITDKDRPAFIPGAEQFPFTDACRYTVEGVTCTVPAGHYFVMGDNRDNSLDSRFWGFVPDANLVGRAFFVWMNFGNLGRIGAFN
jgi:signal peptidase I